MEKQYKNFPFPLPEDNKNEGNIYPSAGRITKAQDGAINTERPTIITVLCGYFFVSWCLTAITWLAILSNTSAKIAFNFSVIGSLGAWVGFVLSLVIITSIFGYWLMWKWGVYLYTAAIVFNFVYLLFKTSSFSSIMFLGFLLPITVIIVGFVYLKQMD